jgi:hypothetical protein
MDGESYAPPAAGSNSSQRRYRDGAQRKRALPQCFPHTAFAAATILSAVGVMKSSSACW